MLKINSCTFSNAQIKNTDNKNEKHLQNFMANENFPILKDTFSKTAQSSTTKALNNYAVLTDDKTLAEALEYLNNLNFDKDDITAVKNLGAKPPFSSGKEALDFIKQSGTKIKFEALTSQKIHAQYDNETNSIKINELYKSTQNKAEIFAIAEAILHEAGHSKDKDGISSVQEEIDCLSLNAISHRALLKEHKNAFDNTTSPIVKDGVCIYADLFFDADNTKKGLISRLKEKYGDLPAGDLKHPASSLAFKIKDGYI